ncbi:hypothetical protein QTN47_27260 [Danxiaibacter flavus]|uniref:Uncharacterized protein n=1 Tax=Danxiaibacter flavus TaxID=3049108 RepID=A0ABV3ZN17_9BACT|nr:hypothetical protein QNM32_27260 [Chitinophagaceae bacterium DXS]
MKLIPILFSTPMVQAILDRRKTQTRRIVKPAIEDLGNGLFRWKNKGSFFQVGAKDLNDDFFGIIKSGKWQKGDGLWVKESFKVLDYWEDRKALHVIYQDHKTDVCILTYQEWAKFSKWENQEGKKPSLFMFKSLSRIYLQITDVRVECLQNISEADAIAEGIMYLPNLGGYHWSKDSIFAYDTPQSAFKHLFISISSKPNPIKDDNGKVIRYEAIAWDEDHFDCHFSKYNGIYRGKELIVTVNPWVWVVSFKRIEKPIEVKGI